MWSFDDMPILRFNQLFRRTVEAMSVRDLADWFGSEHEPRLRLPPIQRSLVWRNEQIVNFWDSLMRGYPAGTMMVHRTPPRAMGRELVARNVDNETKPVSVGDFQLFDGQQRLSAILLGFGKGQLSLSLKLWVDIGEGQGSGGRLLGLRVNSEGQPFGYDPGKPNEKLPLEERRHAYDEWTKRQGKRASVAAKTSPRDIFAAFNEIVVAGLARARCAVPLSNAVAAALRGDAGIAELSSLANADPAVVSRVIRSIERAMRSEVVLQLIEDDILAEEEYVRFFGRVGQGGTRLTDEELTYSLIKNRYPHIHDRMQAIVKRTGRFASEVDLVLGALRVAKALAPWEGAHDWQKKNRPNPKFVEEIRSGDRKPTEELFLKLVPAEAEGSLLAGALEDLRAALLISPTHQNGLPTMLLARMPRDLLDVLLLFTIKRGSVPWHGEDRDALTAFVLHWLCFVEDDGKASDHCYGAVIEERWTSGVDALARLMRDLERAGVARHAPRSLDWERLEQQVRDRGSRMASWEERFTAAGRLDGPDPGLAIRMLATHSESIKRALLWLQRSYIRGAFPDYDPTSTRDDDLPFDLDHAVPYDMFGNDWRRVRKRIHGRDDLAAEVLRRFEEKRNEVGNSLGNLRWLEASVNRGRGKDELEPLCESLPVVDDLNRDDWNALIGKPAWLENEIADFQRLIDLRTLRLSKRYLEESGISDLLVAAAGATDQGRSRPL